MTLLVLFDCGAEGIRSFRNVRDTLPEYTLYTLQKTRVFTQTAVKTTNVALPWYFTFL